jgi:uncharacterized protein (DUF488 family)
MLEEFGRELSNTDMMKYLFLITRYQDKKSFHFIPYKYGCFSFTAYSDKRKLIEKGILKDSENWTLSQNKENFYFKLSLEDRTLIKEIKKSFGHLQGKELIRYIYLNYPYYALNSEILGETLNELEISEIKLRMPKNKFRVLYTIGYQERSIEEYINCLIKEDVKVLCDVRKNPISRKYGFSKTTLQNALETVGIKYKHLPGLGIPGESRKDLRNLEDYNRLFDSYEKQVLSSSHHLLEMIYKLLQKKKRVALTCFERLPEYCHRTSVAYAICRLFDPNLTMLEL